MVFFPGIFDPYLKDDSGWSILGDISTFALLKCLVVSLRALKTEVRDDGTRIDILHLRLPRSLRCLVIVDQEEFLERRSPENVIAMRDDLANEVSRLMDLKSPFKLDMFATDTASVFDSECWVPGSCWQVTEEPEEIMVHQDVVGRGVFCYVARRVP